MIEYQIARDGDVLRFTLRGDQRNPVVHRPAAAAFLPLGFGSGEFRAAVDAGDLVGV